MTVRQRALLALGTAVLLAALVGLAYAVGQRGCPPPDWAFWRFTEGTDGRTNFACVAGR